MKILPLHLLASVVVHKNIIYCKIYNTSSWIGLSISPPFDHLYKYMGASWQAFKITKLTYSLFFWSISEITKGYKPKFIQNKRKNTTYWLKIARDLHMKTYGRLPLLTALAPNSLPPFEYGVNNLEIVHCRNWHRYMRLKKYLMDFRVWILWSKHAGCCEIWEKRTARRVFLDLESRATSQVSKHGKPLFF